MKKYSMAFYIFLFLHMSFECAFSLPLEPQTLTVNNHTVELNVPSGMQVEFLAPMKEPRFLAFGPDNELLVGSKGNRIYRIVKPYTVAEILVRFPGRNHSIAYRNGLIYVAETSGLYAAPYKGLTSSPAADDFYLVTPLPSQTGGHWSRTVVVGPDQRLYIGIGISGNCSDEYLDEAYPFELRRGGVFILDENRQPATLTPYSSGLRNPIGLAFYPGTGFLYATNAGPDNLGYDLPPEIFTVLHKGSFHGMPWYQYYDGSFRSGECAASPSPRPASEATKPLATFAARSTPQGITFASNNLPETEFRGNGFVAVHGSWATTPGGGSASRRPPKIVMVRFADNLPLVVEDLVTGFQRKDGSRFARPSGIIAGDDGNLYFTSDGGEITGLFRLSRTKKQQTP